MKYIYGKVALVVGASSGMGKACAEYLLNEGYVVYGTSRNASFPKNNLANESSIIMLPMDVTNEATINKAVEYILEKESQINVLLNCAGYALGGAVEDLSLNEIQDIFSTNLFGMMMVCQKVLPVMRKQSSGLIVNISSVAGFIALPFQSMYSSSKYAVEAMTEALRMEVKPFGIKVAMINPGDIKTNFTASRRTANKSLENLVYKSRYEKAVNEMVKSEMSGPGPEIVVKVFAKILKSKNPSIRNVVGLQYKSVAVLKKILPSQLVESIVEKMY